MAEDRGALSPENKQKVVNWVRSKAPNLTCAACGTKSFAVGDHLVNPPVFYPGGGMVIGGIAYPQFFLSCNNCGHTMMFSAVFAGMVPGGGDSNG